MPMYLEKNMNKLKKIVSHPIVVLLSYILTIAGFFVSLSNNIWLQVIAISAITVCFIVVTVFFIKYQLNLKKEKKRLEKQFTEEYFHDANIIVKDVSAIVKSLVDNSLNIKKKSITEDHFQLICENICKSIGSLLYDFCKIEFSVCLKQICVDELLTNDYTSAKTQTIARNGKRTAEREKNDHMEQSISENTSFLTLLKSHEPFWASPNLKTTESLLKQGGSEYKNPDKDYKKYYSSTIVAPISINTKYISNTIIEHSSVVSLSRFHCLAFLCIDSPQTFLPNDKRFHLASVVLATCGDALYPLFENKLVKEIDKV